MQLERDALHGKLHPEILQEDDIEAAACPQKTIDRVSSCLGIAAADVKSDLKKMTPRVRGFVTNHEQVTLFLAHDKVCGASAVKGDCS